MQPRVIINTGNLPTLAPVKEGKEFSLLQLKPSPSLSDLSLSEKMENRPQLK